MKDQRILCNIRAQSMAEQPGGPLRAIQSQVKERLAVIGPFDACVKINTAVGVLDHFGVQRIVYQIPDIKSIYLRAFEIDGLGECVTVRADR